MDKRTLNETRRPRSGSRRNGHAGYKDFFFTVIRDGGIGAVISAASVTVLLFGLIVRHSLPAALTASAPEIALAVHHDYPAALLEDNRAHIQVLLDKPRRNATSTDKSDASSLNAAENARPATAADPASDAAKHFEALLFRAARSEPLSPDAFRILGEIALAGAHPVAAENYLKIASELSLHDSRSVYWLMQNEADKRHFREALYYADALLLTQPGTMSYAAPTLTRVIEDASSRSLLIDKIAENPAWRAAFFSGFASGYFSNPATPPLLFLGLKERRASVDLREVDAWLNYLVSRQYYSFAYTSWLRLLPEDKLESIAFLNNGGFETNPISSVFDWTIGRGVAVSVSIARPPGSKPDRALLVNFGYARLQFPSVRQMVVLPAGPYVFGGEFKSNMNARRGLTWNVVCVKGQRIAQSEILGGVERATREFSFNFLVPKENCDAQYVSLEHAARSPSEQFASGYIWFDNVKISRSQEKGATKAPGTAVSP